MTDSAAPSPKRRRGRRFLLLLAALLGAGLLATVCWPWLRVSGYLNTARGALRRGDFSGTRQALQKASALQPDRADVQYLLAVCHRRAGRLDRFEEHLRQASRLGSPEDDVQRQRLLAAAQTGHLEAVESPLLEIIQEGAADDAAEEIYEALATGYLATYRLRDAWKCLDSWLQWRPQAPRAHVLRADIYARLGKLPSAADDYRAVLEQFPEDLGTRVKLGQVLVRRDEAEEALEHFGACLAIAPNDPDALLGVAQCERQLGANAEARRHLQTALAGKLTPEQRAAALAQQGQLSLSDGKASEAVDALMQAVQLTPAEVSVHYALTRALAAAGERDLAQYHADRIQHIRAQFERMTEITRRVIDSPHDADLRCEAGSILIEQGLTAEGLGWLLSALKCEPKHDKANRLLAAERHFRAGMEAVAEGDWEAVGKAAEALRGVDIYAPHMHFLVGIGLLRTGRLPEALAEFGYAKDRPDTRPSACALAGEALCRLKRYREAQGILTTAVKLDPSLTDARRWLAAVYHDIGAMDDALEELAVIAEQAPNDPRPHRLRGLIFKDFENYRDAIPAYRESLGRDPNQPDRPEILFELAECLVKQRQYREALETIRLAPRSANLLALEAECRWAQGDKGEARRLVDEALELDPKHLDAMRLKATLDLEENKVESAVRVLCRAVEHHPKDFRLRYQLARAYQRLGEADLAEEQLDIEEELRQFRKRFTELHKEAIANPANAETRYQLGLVAQQLDEPELARDWFVASLGMDPDHAGAREALEAIAAKPPPKDEAEATP